MNHNPPPQHKYSEHDLTTTSLGQTKMTLQNVFNGGSTVSQSDIEDSENDDDDDEDQTDEEEEEEPHVSQHPPTDIVRVRSSLNDPNLSLYPRSVDAHSFYVSPVGLPPRTKFTPAKKPATPSKSVAAIVAAASVDATLDGDYALALKLDAELNGASSAPVPPVYSVSLGAGDAFLPPPPPPPADDVFPPPPPPMVDVDEENALQAAAARAAALKPAIPFRPRSHPDQVTESSVSAVAYKVPRLLITFCYLRLFLISALLQAIASLLPPPPLAAPCYPAMSCSSPPRVNSPRDPNHSEQPAMSRALLSFDLRMIYEPAHTGYEPTPNYPIEADALIAGRYQILSLLGSAAFSDAIECYDIVTDRYVCVKIIKRHKDFFMGLDEIKLLRYLNSHDPHDDRNIVQLLDYFFFKEHIFLVSELLKENLYECGKRLRHAGEPSYFTIPRLQRVAKQVLVALEFLHSLDLVHTDLKPENILFKSYSRCEVKVIDFGSSCFTHEELSYYVQSRSYRAPEVIIGVPYNTKIDLWSLGCIIAELYTGRVLFPNDSVQTLLARVVGLFGPFPDSLLRRGRFAHKFFTADRLVYERPGQPGGAPQDDDENQEEMEEDLETDEQDDEESDNDEDADLDEHERRRARQLRRRQRVSLLLPTPVSLQQKLDNCDDELFVDFIRTLLTVEPEHRPSATEAMLHPWFSVNYENQ
jgi:serine/threonine protein kinase